MKSRVLFIIGFIFFHLNQIAGQGKYELASQKLLTKNDLELLTKKELIIMRNEIFARHGYVFSKQEMADYFKKQAWYTPLGDNAKVIAGLSETENANIKLIKEMESIIDDKYLAFLKLFENPNTTIPTEFVRLFLDKYWTKQLEEEWGCYYTSGLIRMHEIDLVIYRPNVPEYLESLLKAATFNKEGIQVYDFTIGESLSESVPVMIDDIDNPGMAIGVAMLNNWQDFEYTLNNDMILIIKSSSVSINSSFLSERIDTLYYKIEPIGEINEMKEKNKQVILERKYPQSSTTFLDENELRSLSPEELKLMRNEIFAALGYIFKTQEMNDYFSRQPWYKPESDDVTDKLNVFEKQNIQLLKKLEGQ